MINYLRKKQQHQWYQMPTFSFTSWSIKSRLGCIFFSSTDIQQLKCTWKFKVSLSVIFSLMEELIAIKLHIFPHRFHKGWNFREHSLHLPRFVTVWSRDERLRCPYRNRHQWSNYCAAKSCTKTLLALFYGSGRIMSSLSSCGSYYPILLLTGFICLQLQQFNLELDHST